jgi:hypothetical protein
MTTKALLAQSGGSLDGVRENFASGGEDVRSSKIFWTSEADDGKTVVGQVPIGQFAVQDEGKVGEGVSVVDSRCLIS